MEKLKGFIFIASSDGLAIVERSDVNEIAQRRQAGVACMGSCLSHNFSQEIRKTPRITSPVAPIFRGVSVSTSLRSSIDSGRTKREEAFTSGEIIETRSRLSAV